MAVASGAGARVVVSASFATEGLLRLVDAAFGGSCSLSAVVVPHLTASASFWGAGVPFGITPVPVAAAFAGAGAENAVTGQIPQWTGTGALSCPAVVGLRPSGMTKSGTGTSTASWVQMTGWTPDTANYPGSAVNSNALVSQGAKTAATVSSSVAFSTGTLGNSIAIRLKKNGVLIGTAGTASSSSPATVSATTQISVNDLITVEVTDTNQFGSSYPATITAGSSTYVRIA